MTRSCQKTAIRTKPALWETVKAIVKKGEKGGPSGKWSARKSQLAVKMYKNRGGGYIGPKSKCNSLTKWSKEDWGYVGQPGSSRYLPRKVRQSLTKREKQEENRRKGSKRGEWVPYSPSVYKKMKKMKIF
jgi:hypothetical protein